MRKADSITSIAHYGIPFCPQSWLQLVSQYQDTNFGRERAEKKMKLAVKATRHHRRVLHTVTVFT